MQYFQYCPIRDNQITTIFMQATMRVSRDKDVPADTALAAKYLFSEKYGKSSFSIYIFHLYIYIFHLYIYILNKGK